MTADRKPVKWAARWIARLEAASPLIRMGSLLLTGLSTALIVLNQYGYAQYARLFVAAGIGAGIVFVYFYTEGGVYNQQKRDMKEFGHNFAGPHNRIDDEMIARPVIAGLKGRPLTDKERSAIRQEADAAYADLRDGIDIDALEDEFERPSPPAPQARADGGRPDSTEPNSDLSGDQTNHT